MVNTARKVRILIKDWIESQLGKEHELFLPWRCSGDAREILPDWVSPNSPKVFGGTLPQELVLGRTTILGGICSVFSGDEVFLRETSFSSGHEFAAWLQSWYPRLDQIHDTVGVPPKGVVRIVYVCEDSLFGRKMSRWTKIDPTELGSIVRSVHETQGHAVLVKWLRQWGYRGKVEVVYTSDLEKELSCAIRIWQKIGQFRTKDPDYLKVVLMYTGLWLDVLGLKGQAVIFEPANHTNHFGLPTEVVPWFNRNPYGLQGSINQNLGLVGYMPFWGGEGITRKLPFSAVPNRENWKSFVPTRKESGWYAVNMLFNQGLVRNNSLSEIPYEEIVRRVKLDLATYFS